MRFAFAVGCWLCVCLIGTGGAQQIPDAPAGAVVEVGRTLSGVITDSDGALVPGAQVTLLQAGSGKVRNAVADGNGHFSFSEVAAGAYTLTVAAEGMLGATRSGVLNADESSEELPPIVLGAAASDQVQVSSLTQQEIAEVQMKQEEQQRLLGVVPNFYVEYDWNAKPLTAGQKYRLALRAVVDPANFVVVGGFAGIEQATNQFSGYGQGAAGYGKRYGAGLADSTIGGMLGGAVFPALFHQDPRYFYKGTGTVWGRAGYAMSTAVRARGDNGKWQPAYAALLGDFATGAISNLYYPPGDQTGAGLTIENGFLNVAFDAVGNLLQEFVLKKLSTGVKGQGAGHP